MKVSRTATRRSAAAAVVAIILVGPFIAWQSAQGGESGSISTLAPRGIVVVGDSITARYNNEPGSADQGWWSLVGHHYDAAVTTYAQSGSGYLRPGLECTGDKFIDRTHAYLGDSPSILIVEGGRNDWARCANGAFAPATDAEVGHAVGRYLDVLQTYLPHSTRIIVLGPPWGPLDRSDGVRVTRVIEQQAAAHNVQFISTNGALNSSRVIDGIHPNRAGSEAIADKVITSLGG